jgi:transcriptional regulator with XRE-family HTH domain
VKPPNASRVPARVQLRKWLENTGTKQKQLAELLSKDKATICSYLSGRARPSFAVEQALEFLTGIPANDWRSPKERRDLQRLRKRISSAA